ncbi:hypothetical protein Psi02_05830 [Planotetraspora silvatica]|uniref:Uncharacterized protein n=1 Tax=Planotetraspora silvatica TaxID=234614 RepID=A0A8J3UKV9_9ACTN|nr:hypothetical protein Psi02_05830 [Planotetraspora silvatica]
MGRDRGKSAEELTVVDHEGDRSPTQGLQPPLMPPARAAAGGPTPTGGFGDQRSTEYSAEVSDALASSWSMDHNMDPPRPLSLM